VPDAISIEEPIIHTEERRVQRHELDSQGHVNNSVYVAWAEQAITNALRAVGWPPERFTTTEFSMTPLAVEVDYLRSALDNEPIWIVTRLAEVGRDRAAWHNEIRHGATGELIAKTVSVRVFTDAKGPRSIPDALEIALVQRQKPLENG
jgi:YbgC/YbaW family acyl-CoA thioester hydrolase